MKRQSESITHVVVMTNVLVSLVLVLGYTMQLVFTSLQQCYMPYGYVFSNDESKRKTNSMFEMLDWHDDWEVSTMYMMENAQRGDFTFWEH